jgi:DNA-binding transcriptional LysR family regulator
MRKLDLNLITALDALLSTHSVSRAAERMAISQPAMSATLSRLRKHFGDELLSQSGRHMVPTAFAETLHPLVGDILRGIDTLVSAQPGFDPALSQRRFRLATSDYITLVLIGPLMRRLQSVAPALTLEIVPTTAGIIDALDAGEIDLLVVPEGFASPHHPSQVLMEEEHVVVGCRKNPVFASALTREIFLGCGHVAVAIGQRREAVFIERELNRLGVHRRIELTVSSFLSVPWVLEGTNRLAMMHARLAAIMAKRLPLQVARLPFEVLPMQEILQFHRSRIMDPGILWLCGQLKEEAATLHPYTP